MASINHLEAKPLSRRRLALLLAPVLAITVAATVANALAPTLLADHPLLLLGLNPLFRYMVATAVLVDPVPFFMVALVGKLATDPIFYFLGRRYGDAAVRWIEQKMGAGEYVRTVERWFVRARYPVVFLAPNRLVCTLAGATRMRLRSFIVLNLTGTLTTIFVARSLSGALAGPIGAFVRFTDRYQWWLTALTVTAVLVSVTLQRRRGDEAPVLETADDPD
jgi:membrane protein DedA with SNARE-associated domain